LNETLGTNEVAITFVNHATFLIQTGGTSILTDPVWSERASPFRWIGPKLGRKPGGLVDGLPTIDIVLLSHNHYDHLDVATLTQLRHRFAPIVLAAAGDGRIVDPLGFKDVRELDWWEEIEFNDTPNDLCAGADPRAACLTGKSLCGYMIESVAPRVFRGRH
jgi:L-ascorbate metabolism protein UlaG (beta-lactamase superfamily)